MQTSLMRQRYRQMVVGFVETLHRPELPCFCQSFSEKMVVLSMEDPKQVIAIEDLPLADDIPIARGSVRTGKRSVSGERTNRPPCTPSKPWMVGMPDRCRKTRSRQYACRPFFW